MSEVQPDGEQFDFTGLATLPQVEDTLLSLITDQAPMLPAATLQLTTQIDQFDFSIDWIPDTEDGFYGG